MHSCVIYSSCQGHLCTGAVRVTDISDIGVLDLQGSDACNDGAIQIQRGLFTQLNVCLHTHITQHHFSILGAW